MVNHPPHYVGHGIEPIEFIESHNLNFNLGSAVKYIARAPYKGTELLDLKKAKWFLRNSKKHLDLLKAKDYELPEIFSDLVVFEYKLERLIAITEYLGFTIERVYEAYCSKNKINYQRLKEGY